MNLLLDGMPEEVEIGGQSIPISSDFRTGILFEMLLQDDELDSLKKFQTALQLYFPGAAFPLEMMEEAFQKLAWFYRCGAESTSTQENESDAEGPPFSYEHDADYIYSAFLQAYGLDLTSTNLHWWQFRALFRSLPEDTRLMKIIGYRVMKIPEKISSEQRQHYERLKRIYALPKSADRQQLESDLTELLMNGGNPTALLEGRKEQS